jgi:hypothetical protein
MNPLPNLRADREAARQSPKGTILYPRLMVLGSTWVRQDYPGGPMEVVAAGAAERLLLPHEVVA